MKSEIAPICVCLTAGFVGRHYVCISTLLYSLGLLENLLLNAYACKALSVCVMASFEYTVCRYSFLTAPWFSVGCK